MRGFHGSVTRGRAAHPGARRAMTGWQDGHRGRAELLHRARWTAARARSRCRWTTTTGRAAASGGSSRRTTGPATATLSSRLGLAVPAIEVDDDFHFWHYTVDELTQGGRIDYFVCDEAQFYTAEQIDQLAKITDELSIDVFAFGILTDFRTQLFAGSARLIELADHVHTLQVEALCWCGERATHNARTEDGIMVTEGDVIVVGDVDHELTPDERIADPSRSSATRCCAGATIAAG